MMVQSGVGEDKNCGEEDGGAGKTSPAAVKVGGGDAVREETRWAEALPASEEDGREETRWGGRWRCRQDIADNR